MGPLAATSNLSRLLAIPGPRHDGRDQHKETLVRCKFLQSAQPSNVTTWKARRMYLMYDGGRSLCCLG